MADQGRTSPFAGGDEPGPPSPVAARDSLLVVAPSAGLYGADRALLNALPALVESFSVTVAVPEHGPLVGQAEALGASVVVLPDYAIRTRHLRVGAVGPWLVRVARAVVALSRLHRRERFVLVYSNTLAAGLGPLLRVLWRRPHVLHIREVPNQGSLGQRALLRVMRATANRVICNSAYTRNVVVATEPGLDDRAVVVHNGMDLPSPVTPVAAPPGQRLRVVCVGRIHPKKGQSQLVEAARLAAAEGSDWELHFYGDALAEHAHLQVELEELVERYGLGDRVFFHGFVADTQALYAGADVAVVPSVVPEEFSLVCVEAQSMELPVVATGPGGPSEVLADGETGFVVPPRDPVALAAAIRRLEMDPVARKEMGRKGRARMLAHFTREAYAGAVASCLVDAAVDDRQGRALSA